MGNYSNKIPNPFSATSGSGSGDDPSRITQVLILAVVGMLFGSIFAGSAAAASVTGISADDPTYSENLGEQFTYIGITADNANAGDTETISIDSGSGDFTLNQSGIEVSGGAPLSVNNITDNGDGTYDIVVEYTSSIDNTSTSYNIVTPFTVSEGGEATVSVDNTQQSTTFQYSELQGTVEIGNITTSDGASVSPSVEFVDESGTVVASASNISESYSTQLAEGSYTVEATADGYEDLNQSVSVSYNSNTTVDLDFSASSTETATPTETETDSTTTVDYEVTVEDNGSALDSFDISLEDNDSDVASASVGENDSNTVTFQNLSEGDYTLEVNYTDSDGNETTYTESVTVDSEDAENGTVSQTVDVDESSDDGYFGAVPDVGNPLGGISDAFDGLMDSLPTDDTDALIVTLFGGFVVFVGGVFVIIWTFRGLWLNF